MRARAAPKEAAGTTKQSSRVGELTAGSSDQADESPWSVSLKTLGAESLRRASERGPRITAAVTVNGVECPALLDTGSPVTVISLDYLVKVQQQNHPNLTEEEARREVTTTLVKPTTVVRTYDDTVVSVAGVVKLQLSCRTGAAVVPVLVQRGAPQDLLLGTNAMLPLGIYVVLKEEPPSEYTCSRGPPEANREGAVVKLLKTVKVPAQFTCLTPAELGSQLRDDEMVVIENHSLVNGITVEPTLSVPRGKEAVVLLCNLGLTPVTLEEGTELGRAFGVDILHREEPTLDETQQERVSPTLNTLSVSTGPTNERAKHLCRVLGIADTKLTLAQRDELTKLVLQYAEEFTLEGEPLGATSLATHSIDTGDHEPIKQYA